MMREYQACTLVPALMEFGWFLESWLLFLRV